MFDFSSYILNPTFSDITIKVNEEKFYGHKIVLASRSPYFEKLFKTENIHEYSMEAVSSESIQYVLEYIYTGNTTKSSKNENVLLDVIRVAHQLSLTELETTVLKTITLIISIKNFTTIFNAANLYNIVTLQKVCYTFINEHSTEISKSDCLSTLSKKSFSNLFQKYSKSEDKDQEKQRNSEFVTYLKSLENKSNNMFQDHDTPSEHVKDEPDGRYQKSKRRVSSCFEGPFTRSRAKAEESNKRPKTTNSRTRAKLTKNTDEQQNKDSDDSNVNKEIEPKNIPTPFKVTDINKNKKVGVVVSNLADLVNKVKKKFKLLSDVSIVLAEDGTEISDEEYFATLEAGTNLMVLETSQKWMPLNLTQELGVDVIDHPRNTQSELIELIEKLKSNVCHVSLLRGTELELLADMDPVNLPSYDQIFLKNLKESSGRYLSEKRQAQDAIDLLKFYQKMLPIKKVSK